MWSEEVSIDHHGKHFPEMAEDTSESHPLENGTSTDHVHFLHLRLLQGFSRRMLMERSEMKKHKTSFAPFLRYRLSDPMIQTFV